MNQCLRPLHHLVRHARSPGPLPLPHARKSTKPKETSQSPATPGQARKKRKGRGSSKPRYQSKRAVSALAVELGLLALQSEKKDLLQIEAAAKLQDQDDLNRRKLHQVMVQNGVEIKLSFGALFDAALQNARIIRLLAAVDLSRLTAEVDASPAEEPTIAGNALAAFIARNDAKANSNSDNKLPSESSVHRFTPRAVMKSSHSSRSSFLNKKSGR